ncbi:MAG: ATP-binding protein, partial [Pseudomonadota bacterium]
MRHIERPFPGLRSFAKNESAIFFGRDEQTATMIDRMSRSHFLCITGPSGCGKSSLGRTGLMNGLEAGFLAGAGSDWVFVDHRPEDQPMRNLCEALALAIRDDEQSDITISPTELADSLEETLRASPRRLPEMIDHLGAFKNREVLLFVDQFEELFRFAQRDRNEASAFIETLTTTAARESNIRVAITTRIESLEHSSYFDGLSQAIAKGLFLTPSMDRFQLQQAIEGPAELFSGKIDPDFSLWLLNQMDGQADQLPLMQHTLRVLWERKGAVSDGPPTLTREDFDTYFQRRGTGDGVRRDALEEALTAHLNEVYGAMSEDDQVLSRRMFCALADPLSTRRDNRTPQYVRSLAEISGCKVNDVIRVLDPFRADGADFLLPPFQEMLTPETQIDIRHEAILRRWVPLSGTWLQEEARNGERMQTYARNARDYANGDDELLRGTRLDTAEDWVQRAKPNAGWGRRFLRNIDWMVQEKTETAPRRMVPDEVFDKTMDYVQQSKNAEEQRLELRLAERNRLRKLKKRRRSAVALAMFSVFSFLPIGYILWKTYGGGFLDSQRIGAIEDDLVSRGIFMSNDSLGATLYTRLTPEERETADALAPEVLAAEKAHENRLADWKKKFQKTPDPGVPTEVELDKLERVAAEGEGAESVWVGRLINSMMENEGGCAPLPQWSRPPFAADGFAGCQLPVR